LSDIEAGDEDEESAVPHLRNSTLIKMNASMLAKLQGTSVFEAVKTLKK